MKYGTPHQHSQEGPQRELLPFMGVVRGQIVSCWLTEEEAAKIAPPKHLDKIENGEEDDDDPENASLPGVRGEVQP